MDDKDDETRAAVNPQPPFVPVGPTYWGRGFVWGLLSGWILIFLPFAAALFLTERALKPDQMVDMNIQWLYGGSLLLLLPLVQGFVGGLKRGRNSSGIWSGLGFISALWAVDTAAATIFLHEGVICLIMAAPLLISIVGLGYTAGRAVVHRKRATTVSVSLLPLALLVTIGEATGPTPNHPAVISDSVTVNAPASYVWKYVVDYPDNPNPPDYWMWRMGLPAPTHSVAPVQAVGASRECQFTGGQRYEERIIELEPNKKLTFAVTQQMQHPEILGHVTFDQGQITLQQNADGTTTLTTTGWYRLHVRPAGYFDLWAADLTRHIHARTLGYMKSLAERDYRMGTGK